MINYQFMLLLASFLSVIRAQEAYRPKTVNGEFCMIPYEYQGKFYHDCITEGDTKPWCRPSEGQWGYCANVPDFSSCKMAAPTITADEIKQILDLANNIRSKEPALRMAKLRWNTELAHRAQHMSNQCRLGSDNTNLCTSQAPMGQISYATMSSVVQPKKWPQFILEFFNKKSTYDFETNKCTAQYCNGYKQLVNAKTTDIGCAMSSCNKDSMFADYYFCNFYPPIYQDRPYEKGDSGCNSCFRLNDAYTYQCNKSLCEICDKPSSDCKGKEELQKAVEAGQVCDDLDADFCNLNASICPNIDLLPDEYKVMVSTKCKKTCKLC
uniref:GLIPR1-like protein n=1 Tax=Dugesia japonica TaxID=6161 RepID=A0AAN0N7Z3_DUGJA